MNGLPLHTSARLATALLSVVIAFQIAVVAGAPVGRFTQGGQTDGVLSASGRGFAVISIAILVVMQLGVLAAVHLGPWRNINHKAKQRLMVFTTAYGGVAVAANLASRSTAERAVWTPMSIVLLVLFVRVLQGMPRTD